MQRFVTVYTTIFIVLLVLGVLGMMVGAVFYGDGFLQGTVGKVSLCTFALGMSMFILPMLLCGMSEWLGARKRRRLHKHNEDI